MDSCLQKSQDFRKAVGAANTYGLFVFYGLITQPMALSG
jgi:hypothetical protein